MAKYTEIQRKVRAFMRAEVADLNMRAVYAGDETATGLAERAAWEFDPSDTWLDDETHWVWEYALEFFPSV